MAVAPKFIYRVRQLLANDMAVVSEVKDDDPVGGSGPSKEIRNGKIRLGGVDSFWHVSGVKREPKFAARKEDAVPGIFPSATSTILGRMKGGSDVDLPPEFVGLAGSGKLDAISIAQAHRMSVGFSAPDITSEDLVANLRGGTLSIPSRGTIDAIEVRPNCWITSGFFRLPNGLYGFTPQTSVRSVPIARIEGRADVHRLASGLVLFATQPRWSFAEIEDIRPEDEIAKSTEEWLARIEASATAPGQVGLLEQFRSILASSVGESEQEDLRSALKLLSSRSALATIVPKVLSGDKGFQDALNAFRDAEQGRLREEIRKQLVAEANEQREVLTGLNEKIAEAEARIAAMAHREVLLRNESSQHEAAIREKIAQAAREVSDRSSEETKKISQEIQGLKSQITLIEATIGERRPDPDRSADVNVTSQDILPEAPSRELASDQDQARILKELASATGVTETELMAALLFSLESVPVIVGESAAGLAAEIVSSFGGDHAAVVFCGPTHVSVNDLLNDELSGFRAAIDFARGSSDVLVPVALCGLTNSPCEFWLPQLLDMRRIGKLPQNLSFVASAGADGMRVQVPNSVLTSLLPIAPTSAPRPGAASSGKNGLWPRLAESDADRRRVAFEVLTDSDEFDSSFHKSGARILSRLPVAGGLKLSDVANVLYRQTSWSSAVKDGSDHPMIMYFKNFGG